jgi:hypothetical protein
MEGYEDIENITNRQNEMLDNSLQQQKDIINKQTDLNVAELQRNKEEIDKDTNKTNRALYAEYRKATNPYGENAEGLASKGLGNSGYAETTQANLYNTYQKNITNTLNNARDLKSDFDFQISKARQTGDITLAQNALQIYNQKMQLLTQEYEMRNNRKQFLYQQERDRVSDNQWQQQYDYQKSRDAVEDSRWQTQFDYQKQRDAVADSQWEKQYALSKKASASRSSSRSSSKKSSSGGGLVANNGISDTAINTANYLKSLQQEKGIFGKMGNAVVNQGKQQVAEMVSKGQLSKADAEYIFEQIGG